MRALMAFCWTEFGLMYVLPSLISFVYEVFLGPDCSTCRPRTSKWPVHDLAFLPRQEALDPSLDQPREPHDCPCRLALPSAAQDGDHRGASFPISFFDPAHLRTPTTDNDRSTLPCSRVFQKRGTDEQFGIVLCLSKADEALSIWRHASFPPSSTTTYASPPRTTSRQLS